MDQLGRGAVARGLNEELESPLNAHSVQRASEGKAVVVSRFLSFMLVQTLPLASAQRCNHLCAFLPPLSCRWRKLEGSDPTTYEMILKIQAGAGGWGRSARTAV